jgi:hypothetical protein
MPSFHSPDRLAVAFDDEHAVASAGLVLPALLAQRLGIQQLADELIDLGLRPGAGHPGSKVLTLVHRLLAGGDCIDDDADLLRAGSTAAVLGHRVLAPSTPGTFLSSFTFGACPPAGPAGRTDPDPGLGSRSRTGRAAVDGRSGLDRV